MNASPERAQEQDKGDDKGPAVEVLYLNTNEEVKFHAAWDETLQHVWDESYGKLGETKRANDELQCQDGVSLMPYLTLTLAEMRDKHLCQNRKFAIRSETGGA
jgi:hypothetical protein